MIFNKSLFIYLSTILKATIKMMRNKFMHLIGGVKTLTDNFGMILTNVEESWKISFVVVRQENLHFYVRSTLSGSNGHKLICIQP